MALYQGAPKRKEITNLAMAASENPLLADAEAIDPILICTAFRKPRFFMFTLDQEEYVSHSKCIINYSATKGIEMFIMRSQLAMIVFRLQETKPTKTGTAAVMHTTLGDIFFKLFPAK